jgi:hypothetical protein
MTRALESVFSQLSSLPADEQDRIAGWLRAELESEVGWSQRFTRSQDVLSAMADEALADAVGILRDDGIVWFWIGSHQDYDRLLAGH